MTQTPEDKVIFRTGEGDYDVSLFSTEGKLKYTVSQKAIRELRELTDQVVIRKEAIAAMHSAIQEIECTEKTKIEHVRARTETGQYKEWEVQRQGETFKGLDLQAVQILDLVSFNQAGDEFDVEESLAETDEL